MASIRPKQSEFVRMVGLLIAYATQLGYELTFGDAWSRTHHTEILADGTEVRSHKRGSFHYKRLAIDLNLFKDGVYLRSTEAHRPLGEFWESIGGTWGGRFDDGNHYSFGE